jgi:glycosyltransferase involved in cell wall biosynthesis
MEQAQPPFVSVIIPVFNDGERLRLCLAALAEQTYGRSHFEVIVVDNGSEPPEPTKTAVEHYANLGLNVTLAFEPTPGSYAARNLGISLAQGDAIAFTDADCIPASDWLERGMARLRQTPNCGQVVGKVNLFFADPGNPTAVELYESLTAFPQERLLSQFHGGATANVLTWRRVIEQVGSFNTRLKSNGDLEWGNRVFQAGYEQVYAADVQVQHPTRRSWGDLYKRTVRLAGGVFDRFIQPDDSFVQRHKMFARLLLDDLTPPVNFVISTFRNPAVPHWQHKLKASAAIFFVRYISAGEKLRLKFGGASNRG